MHNTTQHTQNIPQFAGYQPAQGLNAGLHVQQPGMNYTSAYGYIQPQTAQYGISMGRAYRTLYAGISMSQMRDKTRPNKV